MARRVLICVFIGEVTSGWFFMLTINSLKNFQRPVVCMTQGEVNFGSRLLGLMLFSLLFLSLLVSVEAVGVEDKKSSVDTINSSSNAWENSIAVLTAEPVWNDRDSYDASHVLMVPMHFAFVAGDAEGVQQFEGLMSRFASQELPGGQLNQAQWMYFVSRYLALRAEFKYPITGVDAYLVNRVEAWLHNRWRYEPAYQWEKLPFFGTQARIQYIQSKLESWPYSYYPAVTDYELFLFAAASDIHFVREKNPKITSNATPDVANSINELVATAVNIVRDRGVFTKGNGWLFQLGVWTDHPDYTFAGHSKISSDLREARVADIAEDSSHSHRWPLLFRSMVAATNGNSIDKGYLQDAYSGFCKQFRDEVVVIKHGNVLLKNFMDGSNGVYRYRYATVGKNANLGYGPYALSGIMGESWYSFCSDVGNIFDVYEKSYPLSKEILDTYVGPNTSRDRNPLFTWPNYFTSGFAELLARQSAFLASNYVLHP